MKFLHLSDLHIGKRLKEQSFIEDQQYILDKIVEIADREKPDGVIIAGDIYDKSVPSAEAVALFDRFLTNLSQMKIKIYAVSGNHDSAERIAFGAALMKQGGVYFSPVYNGSIMKITEEDEYGRINIFLLPFVKPSQVREFFPETEINDYTAAVQAALSELDIDESERNIIIAHQFVTGASKCGSEEVSIGGLDNVDGSVFEKFDYTALGHIHGQQSMNGGKMRYCGTPLKYSFSEAGHTKSVTVAEFAAKGSLSIQEIPLVPKRDMRDVCGKFEDILVNSDKSDDYVRVILSDENEILNAAGRLRHIFPNILEICYSSRHKAVYEIQAANDDDIRNNPEAVFAQFYYEQKGRMPDEEESAIMAEIISEAKEALK